MEIVAPCSKHKKKNLIIYISACLLFGLFFAYDGYLSQYEWSMRHSFYEKHVVDGEPDDTMIFNRRAPLFLAALAVVLAVRLIIVSNKKAVAKENELIINNKEKIPYNRIQKIDKTYFKKKGYFTITYDSDNTQPREHTIRDKDYDNLSAILERLVEKIS